MRTLVVFVLMMSAHQSASAASNDAVERQADQLAFAVALAQACENSTLDSKSMLDELPGLDRGELLQFLPSFVTATSNYIEGFDRLPEEAKTWACGQFQAAFPKG